MNSQVNSPRTPGRMDSTRGFSLMEMLVALAMLSVVLVGALILLDTTNRVTRAQLARADVQQSVRIGQDTLIRHVRTAGRGGLLSQSDGALELPNGIAIAVENNVAADRTLFAAVNTSPEVLQNTDILIVRSIFDNPLYYTEFLDKSKFSINTATNAGWIEIEDSTPEGDFSQVTELQMLEDMRVEAKPGEAVVLMSPFSDDVYGVAQIDWAGSSYDAGNGKFRLAFTFEDDDTVMDPLNPSNSVEAISALSSEGVFPGEVLARSGVKTLGVLQEYRYFIRDTAVSGDVGGRFAPKLSRTRTRVNQDEYWEAGEQFDDIANNVIDLQIALGFSDEGVNAGAVTETADGVGDSWHLNASADSVGSPPPVPPGDLAMVRVSSLARAPAPDRNFEARALLSLEDRTYAASDLNDTTERRHRRFFLQTVVDVRNL